MGRANKRNSSSREPERRSKRARKSDIIKPEEQEQEETVSNIEEAEEDEEATNAETSPLARAGRTKRVTRTVRTSEDNDDPKVLDPVPPFKARRSWPLRYSSQKEVTQAKAHYRRAKVDGVTYSLGEDAFVKAEEGMPHYIARIVEIFVPVEGGDPHFSAQWFYRAQDTIIKESVEPAEKKRIFLSDVKDDNPLNCIVSKLKIALVSPNMDLIAKQKKIPDCDFYYDMNYTLPYKTFSTAKRDDAESGSCTSSTISSESCSKNNSEMSLLDLYSGCGAMSTGLCMGATLSDVKLVTRWAVDINSYACKSLKMNHPQTEVQNMFAEDFLSLIKEWEKLCRSFSLHGSENCHEQNLTSLNDDQSTDDQEEDENDDENGSSAEEVFEVEKLLEVCYGDPNETKEPGMYFKVRWKGYDESFDTWEPLEGLSDCPERLKEFVSRGYHSNILPLPGTVDFVCGGPPCQGISGFNRFRNKNAPLEDPKNHQLVVFMDIVEHLKPRYVLMENVVDILNFADGFLGSHAIGRLVSMNYQSRIGIMTAGSYGLPQYRNRVFLWGSHPSKCLPQYPLPTNAVVRRGVIPTDFEDSAVTYEKDQHYALGKALLLEDAIKDLPPVGCYESRDEIMYQAAAETDFQKYIRLQKSEMIGFMADDTSSGPPLLYDHRPLELKTDDYERVCRIPKKKGACFRDLPGVLVDKNNTVYLDPSVEREFLPSGKPLVPNYAISFKNGKSSKPFGRLWWDETASTVVTRAEPHNQVMIHPEQDRVLTIRENARLQGFPDSYQLYGPIKERYIQVGNAVAVPVALALGFSFGQATKEASDEKPLITLPFRFPKCLSLSHCGVDDSD